MKNTYYIALGDKANGFYDQVTGITVARGEKVEITERQKSSRKIQMALNAGALKIVQPDTPVSNYSESEIKKLDKKLKDKVGKGVTFDKLIKDLTFEQAKALAEFHELDINSDDTVQSIMEAVIEDYQEQ